MNSVRSIIQNEIKEKSGLSILTLFTVVSVVLFSLIPPYILGMIIDTLTLKNTMSFPLILLYFLTLVAGCILLACRDSLLIVTGQKITHKLRNTLMKKEIMLSTNDLTKQKPGSIVSIFISDVDQIELLFTSGIISLIADALQMISIFVLLFIKTKGLFLFMLIVMPLVFLFTRHVQRKTLEAEKENREAVAEANAIIPETLRNMLTIHNLHKESYMEKRYDICISKGYKALTRTNFYDAIYSPVILFINAIVIASLMLATSSANPTILMFFGMSAGNAVAMMNYVAQIFSPIENIGMEIQTIQSAIASVKRIDSFLQLSEKKIYDYQSKPEPNVNPVIQIHDMSFGYEEKTILSSMHLTIQKGEHITLQGRTGAGKSTLFKLILGLYEPDCGNISVMGTNPYQLDSTLRRKVFGYVEQKFHPVTGTIKDQITLFDANITDAQVIKALQITGLYKAIQALPDGINTPIKKELFSQGEWQLLSIARAVVCNPKIMMLDEITSDLDAISEEQIMHVLTQVSEERTVISISHREHAEEGRVIQLF